MRKRKVSQRPKPIGAGVTMGQERTSPCKGDGLISHAFIVPRIFLPGFSTWVVFSTRRDRTTEQFRGKQEGGEFGTAML